MASHPLMLDTVSPCCGILSPRCPCPANYKIPVVLLAHRSSPFHLGVLCSGIESRSSSSKYRTASSSRASKSDADLRRELQLFLVSAGLPPDRVPSTKELSNRGREDLANIVRRRGYKAVGRLLADLEIEPSVKGKGNEVSNLEVSNGSNFASNSTSHASKVEPLHNGSARPVEHSSSDGSNEPVAPKSLVGRLKDDEILARQDGDVEITAKNDKLDGHSLDAYDAGLGSLTEKDTEEQTLHKRASHFVKTGKLDFIMQDFGEEEDGEEDVGDDDYYEYSSEEEDDENEQKSAEAIALEKAAKLHAKLLPFIKGTMSGKMNNEHDDGLLRVMQKPTKFEETYKGDSSIQFAFTAKTEVELDHIKSALRIREVDLVELSRELEETKAQLALVQAKAMAEVAQIKQMALEKEMRLKSADQALANLKKVEIEYWGEGGGVQLAGSFNGWQHFIAMEPDPNSEIAKSDGSRGPMIWGTELWLYPGIYEIKFIVDGNWQIDQRREVMMQSTHQNNILRVEP